LHLKKNQALKWLKYLHYTKLFVQLLVNPGCNMQTYLPENIYEVGKYEIE